MMENTFNKLIPTVFNKKVGEDTVDCECEPDCDCFDCQCAT